ncbi:MAG TPA: hypothetical protein ENH62_02240 [Marinobacter sp.]|nr:hypothetical protein [Marinobacter sp.]HEC61431.1 hypothetical protein [bacterium]
MNKKYRVEKVDGSPIDPKAVYFVMRVDTDIHARKAILAYAESIREDDPVLAMDLEKLAGSAG